MKKLILNLIYPPRCVFCNTRLSPRTRRNVCSECANSLPYTHAYNRCISCGRPIPGTKSARCKDCVMTKQHTTRVTSAFLYTDMAKRGIILLKREAYASNAKTLAEYLEAIIRYDFDEIGFDYVISVPPRKKSSRETSSYDQTAKLASATARRLGIPYLSGAMYQKRKIRKQSTLSMDDRAENVKGNFAVRKPGAIGGKTILLIDDVRTSGSTINECAAELKKNGAYRVYAATLTTIPAT